jgi:hypothetical protein
MPKKIKPKAMPLPVWTSEKIDAVDTTAIIKKLHDLGVVIDESTFKAGAMRHRSAVDLANEMKPGLRGALRDFLELSFCALWKRWLPERPSLEMIDDWILDGYDCSDDHFHNEGLALWRRAWDTLLARFNDTMTTVEKTQAAVFPRYSSLLDWTQDYVQEHVHVSPNYVDAGVRFIDELLAQFYEEHELFRQNILADKADILRIANRHDDAIVVVNNIIRTWPNNAIGYTMLASVLEDAGKPQAAIAALERALAVPVGEADDFDIQARLDDLRARHDQAPSSGPAGPEFGGSA